MILCIIRMNCNKYRALSVASPHRDSQSCRRSELKTVFKAFYWVGDQSKNEKNKIVLYSFVMLQTSSSADIILFLLSFLFLLFLLFLTLYRWLVWRVFGFFAIAKVIPPCQTLCINNFLLAVTLGNHVINLFLSGENE